MVLGAAVPLQQPSNEGEQRDPLELPAALGIAAVVRAPHRRLEALRVAERLGGERRDDLAESDVAVGEGVRIAFGAEEDRANDGTAPPDRHDDDRADIAEVEQRLDVREHRVVRRIRDEHRLAGLERALELGVAIEIDDEIADRRILVARDEAYIARLAGQEDRAAVEAEGLAELSRDRLQNVYEVERGRDFLDNVDERDQLVTLALQLRNLGLQSDDLPTRA